MIKIQSSYSNLFDTKTNNNKIRYKEKGKIFVKPNTQKINLDNESAEDKHINKLTETVNVLVSKVIDLKKQKEQYDKKIRRAINILELKGAKSSSGLGKENDSNSPISRENNAENSVQVNVMENGIQSNTVKNNDNKANSDEINNKETIEKASNTNDSKNKFHEKQEEKDIKNVTNKDANESVSKESSEYAATQITFEEKDMSDKDDDVEKLFVGKTLDELKSMLKEYDSKIQSEIDKLEHSIKTIKAQIFKLKKNEYSNKNKDVNKNNKKKNALDILA